MAATPRERLLWAAAGCVLATLVATLLFARVLSSWFEDQGRVNAAFGVGMLLVMATLLSQGFVRWPSWTRVLVGLSAATGAYFALVRMASAAERSHVIEFALLGALVHEAMLERARRVEVRWPSLRAWAMTVGVGVLDELIQWPLPWRVFDPVDIAFNTIAATMAVFAGVTLRWLSGAWARWRQGST